MTKKRKPLRRIQPWERLPMHHAAIVGGDKEVALLETPEGGFKIQTQKHEYPLDADGGPKVVIEAEKVFIINKTADWIKLAVWLDGEGTLSIRRNQERRGLNKSTQYSPRVTIYNTDMRVIDWLTTHFGGTVSQSTPETKEHKEGYAWELGVKNLVPILRKVLPHLLLKREQALLLIDFYEKAVWHKGGNYKDPQKRQVSKAELARRDTLYQKSILLNAKGPAPEGTLFKRSQITPDDIKRLSNLEDAGVRGGIHAKHTWLVALHDGSLWIAKKTGTEERDEIFVYLLAQKMFRGIVPETVPGYIPKIGWVSIQRKVSGIPAGRVDGLHGYMHGNDEMQADLVAMLVMDYLIGNSDRHANNWFLMHNDRLAAIDNGWAGEDVAMTLSAVFEPADLAGLVRDESLWPKMLQMMLTLIQNLTGRGDEARALAKEIAIDRKEAILMVRLWEPKLARLARFIQTEASKLQKARTYLKPGQQAPAGTQEQEGPRGGRYYESEPVIPGFERPPEYKTEALLLNDETIDLAIQQVDAFAATLDDMEDEPELKEIKYLSMSNSQVRSAMKARITRLIAARLKEAEMVLPLGLSVPDYVSKMLSSWAASSSDDNDDSIAMQLAAAELFNVRSTPYIAEHPRAEYFREHHAGQRHLMRAKMVVQAMYDETQEFFKKQGIEELVLFRGMRWVSGAAPEEVEDVSDGGLGTRQIMPGFHTAEMAFHANPLSSWAYSPEDAVSFANYKPNVEGTEYEGAGGYDFDDPVFLDQAAEVLEEEAKEADVDVEDEGAYKAWKEEFLADKGYGSMAQWAYSDMDIEPPTVEPPATRAVMVSRVPVRKILATAMTGLGCLEESEIVTLGGENFPTQIYAGAGEEERLPNFRDIVVAERDYVEAQTPEAQAAKRKEKEWKTWADANLEDLLTQRMDAVSQATAGVREKIEVNDKPIAELKVQMQAAPTLDEYEVIATRIRQLEAQREALLNQTVNDAEEPFRVKAAQMIEEAGFEVPSGWAPRGQPDA